MFWQVVTRWHTWMVSLFPGDLIRLRIDSLHSDCLQSSWQYSCMIIHTSVRSHLIDHFWSSHTWLLLSKSVIRQLWIRFSTILIAFIFTFEVLIRIFELEKFQSKFELVEYYLRQTSWRKIKSSSICQLWPRWSRWNITFE
jgi:hypothetical protein